MFYKNEFNNRRKQFARRLKMEQRILGHPVPAFKDGRHQNLPTTEFLKYLPGHHFVALESMSVVVNCVFSAVEYGNHQSQVTRARVKSGSRETTRTQSESSRQARVAAYKCG